MAWGDWVLEATSTDRQGYATAMFELCAAVNEREDLLGMSLTLWFDAGGVLRQPLTMAHLNGMDLLAPYATNYVWKNWQRIRAAITTLITDIPSNTSYYYYWLRSAYWTETPRGRNDMRYSYNFKGSSATLADVLMTVKGPDVIYAALNADINNTTEIIVLEADNGTYLPEADFTVTIGVGASVEYVKVTSRDGDTLTCTGGRGSYGSAAVAHTAGDVVYRQCALGVATTGNYSEITLMQGCGNEYPTEDFAVVFGGTRVVPVESRSGDTLTFSKVTTGSYVIGSAVSIGWHRIDDSDLETDKWYDPIVQACHENRDIWMDMRDVLEELTHIVGFSKTGVGVPIPETVELGKDQATFPLVYPNEDAATALAWGNLAAWNNPLAGIARMFAMSSNAALDRWAIAHYADDGVGSIPAGDMLDGTPYTTVFYKAEAYESISGGSTTILTGADMTGGGDITLRISLDGTNEDVLLPSDLSTYEEYRQFTVDNTWGSGITTEFTAGKPGANPFVFPATPIPVPGATVKRSKYGGADVLWQTTRLNCTTLTYYGDP